MCGSSLLQTVVCMELVAATRICAVRGNSGPVLAETLQNRRLFGMKLADVVLINFGKRARMTEAIRFSLPSL